MKGTIQPKQFESKRLESKHGEYKIKFQGNVLRVDGKGIVTQKILEQYLDDVRKITLPLNGAPWGFMGFVSGTGILTPEAEQALVVSINVRKKFGMCACALVTTNADIPTLVKNQFERVYTKARIEYAFCKDEQSAFDWLSTKGCSI